jgi:hypothetical protein
VVIWILDRYFATSKNYKGGKTQISFSFESRGKYQIIEAMGNSQGKPVEFDGEGTSSQLILPPVLLPMTGPLTPPLLSRQ